MSADGGIAGTETVTIRIEAPDAPAGRSLIEASQRALLEVTPPEEIFSLSPEELAQPNILFFVARLDEAPVGCVALVDMGAYGEVKRLYVDPAARGRGIAVSLMQALECQCADLGLAEVRLETGDNLTAALRLYTSLGYGIIERFGDYPEVASSVFMGRRLIAA